MTNILITRSLVPDGLPYRSYLQDLRRDFFRSCNYCTRAEVEAHGIGFQIDHYKPQKGWLELANNYDNLIYSCQPCNNHKRAEYPSQKLEALGYSFVNQVAHVYADQFSVTYDRLTAETAVGKYSIEFLELNRPPLITLREARRRIHSCADFTKAGVIALRGYRIDKLRVRARVNELKSIASAAYLSVTYDIDSILSAYAGADFEVPLAQREAYDRLATVRKKTKLEFRSLEPKPGPLRPTDS
jgi:hypothetical protein